MKDDVAQAGPQQSMVIKCSVIMPSHRHPWLTVLRGFMYFYYEIYSRQNWVGSPGQLQTVIDDNFELLILLCPLESSCVLSYLASVVT